MKVKNNLITESFDYNRAGSIIGDRELEVMDLSDIAEYIRQIGEKLTCDYSKTKAVPLYKTFGFIQRNGFCNFLLD